MIDFRKLSIIIQREYLTRVRTKAFIITTILVPVGLMVLIAVPILLQFFDSDKTYEIAIKDETNVVYTELARLDSTRYFDAGNKTIEQLRNDVIEKNIEGFIVITEEDLQNPQEFEMIYSGGGGINLVSDIRSDLREAIREARLNKAEASQEILTILESRPELNTRKLTEEGKEEEANTFVLFFFGYGMAFVIYGAIFGYGGYVMRSVIEEKTNRIVEIVVSSVKPFELLLGKVLGIGALGVTQFAIWTVTGAGLLAFAGPIAAMFVNPETLPSGETVSPIPPMPDIGIEVGIYFMVFFLLGYLIYSAILAAVGSAVDSESDTQQMMIPVSIPVILAIIILPRVASDPDSTFSIITSMIPFFSPILMVARIPITDVPFWEIGVSILLMIITIIGSLYLGSKIYRTGILMYGKSAGFKELWKWMKQS